MGKQNQSELSDKDKMIINAQMSYLHQSLAFFEVLRINTEQFKTTNEAIQFYLATHAENLANYMDLINAGTEPTRAQSILLESLKRTLVKEVENGQRRIQIEN